MALSRMSTLEVERKFSRLTARTLTINGGNPPFRSLKYLGKQVVHDTYYDTNSLLSSKGTWVRRRNGQWEAKIRRGGDLRNSMFEELSDPKDISHHLNGLVGIPKLGVNFGLPEMASFTTHRQSWVADEEFKIVQDSMDFNNHRIGEVELQCKFKMDGESSLKLEQQRRLKMEEMDARIANFMDRYSWAFDTATPKGKLAAYLEQA